MINIFFIVLVVYENLICECTQLYRRIEEAFCDKKDEIIVSATYRFALKRLGEGGRKGGRACVGMILQEYGRTGKPRVPEGLLAW